MANKKLNNIVQAKQEAAVLAERTRKQAEATRRIDLERIIKTTESMNIVVNSDVLKRPKDSTSQVQQAELASIREAVSRSYELARKKITAEYERIILSNDYVDNPFIAVQVAIRNIDRGWKVETIENTVKKFNDAVLEQISLGRTVYLSEQLVIEPVVYVDRILPAWKATPKFAVLANAIAWEEIVTNLVKAGEISRDDASAIVRESISAITTNVANGYVVKLSRLIVMQIAIGNEQRIVLFSNDTLEKMNEIYLRFVKTGEGKQIRKYDAIIHFDKTLENVEKGFYSEDVKAPVLRPEFVPRDLTQEIKIDKPSITNTKALKTSLNTSEVKAPAKAEVKKAPAKVEATKKVVAIEPKPPVVVKSVAPAREVKRPAKKVAKPRARNSSPKTISGTSAPKADASESSSRAVVAPLEVKTASTPVAIKNPIKKPAPAKRKTKKTVAKVVAQKVTTSRPSVAPIKHSLVTPQPKPQSLTKKVALKPKSSAPKKATAAAPKVTKLVPKVTPATPRVSNEIIKLKTNEIKLSPIPAAPKPASKPVPKLASKPSPRLFKKLSNPKKDSVPKKPIDRVETFSYTTINDTSLHKIIDEDKKVKGKPSKK